MGVKVDRKNPVEGKIGHFLSVSEDGVVNIWDTRPVEKENLRIHTEYIWKPYISIALPYSDKMAQKNSVSQESSLTNTNQLLLSGQPQTKEISSSLIGPSSQSVVAAGVELLNQARVVKMQQPR